MSECGFEMLSEAFDRIDRECDTEDKAQAQMRSEGLLDVEGEAAPSVVNEEASGTLPMRFRCSGCERTSACAMSRRHRIIGSRPPLGPAAPG